MAGIKTVNITYNASGAVKAAKQGDVIVIVDIIDMSTTAEAVLDGGALTVLGASPDDVLAPVTVNPEKMGYWAGKKALKKKTEVIIIAEPRFRGYKKRTEKIQFILAGIHRAGAKIAGILPNIGAQITNFSKFENKVVIIASHTGGVAFDAAYNHGAVKVVTGTIVRTNYKHGVDPLYDSATRAIKAANKYNTGITVVASSANSYEDVLAAERIAQRIVEIGFLNL
ncbi:MAG: hypothetical protein ACQERJ_07285 [Bacillota bacterium]